MARLNTDRAADPLAAGIERFVGLEHIEPEDLRIRRWGLVAEGTTFTNRFRPGQVLFGKRRAYQRKVALADFEGVCSSDIYVFESKDRDVLLPELLPFLCQTEGFFQHAVGTSAGSLSPRTNWMQLAAYAFALPPLEEQRRIAEVLWTLVATENSIRALAESMLNLEYAFLKETFGAYSEDTSTWRKVDLKQIAFVQTGVAKGKAVEPGRTVAMPYIGVSNVQDGMLNLGEIGTIVVEKTKIAQYLLRSGDVLMTEGGDPDKLGRGTVWQAEIRDCVHQNHVFAVRPNTNCLDSWFLAAVARSPYGKQYFLACSKRTSNLATINKRQVEGFKIPLPSLETQREIVTKWLALREGWTRAKSRQFQLQSLRLTVLALTIEDIK